MKKAVFAATLAALFISDVQADTVGLYLGGQIWHSDVNGIFGGENTLRDFNLEKEQQINYYVAVEHPFPFFPNVRISSTTLDTSGNINSMEEYNDDNETSYVEVHVDLVVDASFKVNYVDYTFYYELFDQDAFSFDLGVTARTFGGAATVTETTNTVTTSRYYEWDEDEHEGHDHPSIIETTNTVTRDKKKTNDIEPMLYAATNISLPITGLNVFAQGDFSLTDDHSLYDYQVGLSYDLVDSRFIDFNLALGYRVVKMELEDLDNLYTDLEFKGAFVGLMAHF